MKNYLEYRGQQIGLINNIMHDVHSLAKDVAEETKNQGEKLQKTEVNAAVVHDNVELANEELVKAKES